MLGVSYQGDDNDKIAGKKLGLALANKINSLALQSYLLTDLIRPFSQANKMKSIHRNGPSQRYAYDQDLTCLISWMVCAVCFSLVESGGPKFKLENEVLGSIERFLLSG